MFKKSPLKKYKFIVYNYPVYVNDKPLFKFGNANQKYSFSEHENALLVFGNTILQGGLYFVECVNYKCINPYPIC